MIYPAPGATNNKENLASPVMVETTISLITSLHSWLFKAQAAPPHPNKALLANVIYVWYR
jgi:hypothetical protein